MIIDKEIQRQLLSIVFLSLSAQSVAFTTNEPTLLSTPTYLHNWATLYYNNQRGERNITRWYHDSRPDLFVTYNSCL